MAIEFDVRIIGETSSQVTQELTDFCVRMSAALVVAPPLRNTADAAPAVTEGNGADKPASTRKRTSAKADEPAKLDRAAIIDGLTKIYSKGNEDVRLAITKFRDGQGADRLRDLKDDALQAAAELLIELKTNADQPQV